MLWCLQMPRTVVLEFARLRLRDVLKNMDELGNVWPIVIELKAFSLRCLDLDYHLDAVVFSLILCMLDVSDFPRGLLGVAALSVSMLPIGK